MAAFPSSGILLAENELFFNWQKDHLRSKKSCRSGFHVGMAAGDSLYMEEGSWFTGNPALQSWLDSWSHPWSPVPHSAPWSGLQGVSDSFDHSVHGWQVAALV